MEVKGKSKKDKAPIQQFRCKKRKGANQRWHIVSAGGGSYYFVNHNSGKCLDVKGKSTKDGAQLQQYKCTGGSHQLFKLSPSHSPANQMQAQHSGKCVEVRGASRSDRAQIQQGGCSGAPNQAWLMQ
jgi:hypothetical protein